MSDQTLEERVEDLEEVVTAQTHLLGEMVKRVRDLEDLVKILTNRD